MRGWYALLVDGNNIEGSPPAGWISAVHGSRLETGMERIQAIAAARFAVEDIMLRYAEGIDVGDIETVGDVFAEGELVMPDGSSLVGAKQVFDHFSNLIIFYDVEGRVVPYRRLASTPRTRHVTSNIIYDFNDAVNHASVRSYITCYQTIDDKNEIIFGGRYVDTFDLDEKGWHLVCREILGDNIGDTSHHLKS